MSLSSWNNIKTFDLSTLYTTICYAWWIYFLNIKSSFLWVPTVFLFSSTSICIRMRQTSYRDFSRSTNRSSSDPFISLSAIQVMFFHYISLVYIVDRIYPIDLEIKDIQIQLGLFHTLTYTLNNTMSAG
jgi:hypothetical protein